jgi:uncharacterized protein (DUF1501 family)
MNESRREFLKKSGCALSMAALATQVQHLGMMSALAQKMDDSGTDKAVGTGYKALVLVYWSGGNDGNNVIIPNHNDATLSNYAAYAAARQTQGLALAQNTLLPISVPAMGGLSYGLHPALGPVAGGINNGIHELWAQGDLAMVTNCGTLVAPMTKAQYQDGSVQKPYQLFSHSDQVNQSQTTISNTAAFTGWGGRIADRLNAGENPGGLVPMITSISGAQIFTAGTGTLPMAINNANTPLSSVLNPAGFNNTAASIARRTAFDNLRAIDLDNNYVAAASNVTELAMDANAALQTFQEVTVPFPTSSIGQQLKQVARLIKKRTDLAINRQIFYVQIGSFDTHNGQLAQHDTLLSQFSQAVRAFYDELVVQGVSNDVTTFTLSDFNRTFNPASSGANVGSDHAWANHMMVIGGSVTAGDFYGMDTTNGTPFPTLLNGGPDDTNTGTGSRGRWIPTTSVEQYAATLARWYGLPENQMSEVFPNIGNFPTSNLGFMPPP